MKREGGGVFLRIVLGTIWMGTDCMGSCFDDC